MEMQIRTDIVARLQNKTFLFQEKSKSAENQEKYLYKCLKEFIEYMDAIDKSFDPPAVIDPKPLAPKDRAGNSFWVPGDDDIKTKYDKDNNHTQLLGRINPEHKNDPKIILAFKYLPAMLDLSDPDVHKILPYLLTAYICSVYKSSLFHRGKAGLHEIFQDLEGIPEEEEFFDNPRPSRRKKQIEQISKLFSLKRPCASYQRQGGEFSGPFAVFIESSANNRKTDSSKKVKPRPHIVNRQAPYRDALFIEQVFLALTVITTENEKKILGESKSGIDFKYCLFLFCKHMYPGNNITERLMEEWHTPKSEKLWLRSFRSYYDTLRF